MHGVVSGPILFRTREQAAYEHLRRAITEGRWGPHDPIVGSRIAEDLGVSRITVANALKRLAGEGFVRLTPHREAFVAPMSASEIEDIYVMRAALEAEAAFFAARNASSADVASLRQFNEQIGHTPGAGIAPIRSADLAFHARVRTLSRMPRLTASIGNLVDQCEYYRARLLDSRGLLTPDPRAHDELLEALAEKHGERARAYMREHVLRGMRSLLAALKSRGAK